MKPEAFDPETGEVIEERAAFVDFASQKLAQRLGCHPSELTSEARAAA